MGQSPTTSNSPCLPLQPRKGQIHAMMCSGLMMIDPLPNSTNEKDSSFSDSLSTFLTLLTFLTFLIKPKRRQPIRMLVEVPSFWSRLPGSSPAMSQQQIPSSSRSRPRRRRGPTRPTLSYPLLDIAILSILFPSFHPLADLEESSVSPPSGYSRGRGASAQERRGGGGGRHP